MFVMGSSLQWTVPPEEKLSIRLRGNDLNLESLYRPACARRTLRQKKEELTFEEFIIPQLEKEL